jgi:predicted nuclease of predicted toxin-antitoxin system
MRFVLDEDVDAGAVGSVLRNQGHDCWTIVEAGLGGADDDAVATYADNRNAVLVTHDAEATRRRRKLTFGRHLFLRCHQLQAAGLIANYLEDLVTLIAGRGVGVYEVRHDGVTYRPPRYEPD